MHIFRLAHLYGFKLSQVDRFKAMLMFTNTNDRVVEHIWWHPGGANLLDAPGMGLRVRKQETTHLQVSYSRKNRHPQLPFTQLICIPTWPLETNLWDLFSLYLNSNVLNIFFVTINQSSISWIAKARANKGTLRYLHRRNTKICRGRIKRELLSNYPGWSLGLLLQFRWHFSG